MRASFFQIEVPRPKADKTGRRSRTGPLTLHQIAQEKLLKAQAGQLTAQADALKAQLAAQADELSALRAVAYRSPK